MHLDTVDPEEDARKPLLHVVNDGADVRLKGRAVNLTSNATDLAASAHIDQVVGAHIGNLKPIQHRRGKHEASRDNLRNHQYEAVAVVARIGLRIAHDGSGVVEPLVEVPPDAAAQRERTGVLNREPDAGTADVGAPVDAPQARINRERRLHHRSFL